jgi:hypothetical protein
VCCRALRLAPHLHGVEIGGRHRCAPFLSSGADAVSITFNKDIGRRPFGRRIFSGYFADWLSEAGKYSVFQTSYGKQTGTGFGRLGGGTKPFAAPWPSVRGAQEAEFEKSVSPRVMKWRSRPFADVYNPASQRPNTDRLPDAGTGL